MNLPLSFPSHITALKLLVVDDQDFDLKMICSRLREVAPPDTVIMEAESGKAALELISKASVPFDCVLLDMNLPDIHGVDLTPMLLNLRPELSIVMITVEADMDKALKCLKVGAEDFLIKGEYSNITLYRSVRYSIERRRASIENIRLSKALDHERELSAAQKEFISLVSHEFRTPIAIISGAVQLLSSKAPELYSGAGAPQFNKINASLKRLTGLLDNVVRLSKVEEGKEVFMPTTFDLSEMIRDIIEYFDVGRIDYKLGDKPASYFGDQRLAEYALHNIISNAIKYSPKDSKITLTMNASKTGYEIIVVDKGAGMSADMLSKAGQRFHRDSRTAHIEGTGLGLHLAQRFMEYHSGSLTIESEVDKGTTVTLFFPHAAENKDK